jgi:uncharacterized YigZ family protein
MNTIRNNATTSFVTKKSTFIGYIFPCSNRDDLKSQLDTHWKLHPKATHICVAFVGDNIDDTWFDDNGEPTHSAGKVMLNVLLKQNLFRTGAFVVRYYGGVNLGVGGLVKAYTNAMTETLKNSLIKAIEHKPQIHFNLCFEHGFALWETLKRKKWDLDVKQHDEYLSFSIMCTKEEIMAWLSTIPSSCYGEITENLIEI